ncbi:hypothetical protein ACIPYS_23570 [Kitasatospora sp. NPDC089913]|uniref:hypothetical protein n=1 Tax=Kitasatospora sp. NPDC089913 TaxID=3364080 RepID=UPI003804A9D9
MLRTIRTHRRRATRTVAASTLTAAALTMVLAGAQGASAATTAGQQCRGTGWGSIAQGVNSYPCAQGNGLTGISGSIDYDNLNHLNILPCAELLLVNSNGSTTSVRDFGCGAWSTAGRQQFYTATRTGLPVGTYVVAAGFWYNGTYYGNLQSGRVSVF